MGWGAEVGEIGGEEEMGKRKEWGGRKGKEERKEGWSGNSMMLRAVQSVFIEQKG